MNYITNLFNQYGYIVLYISLLLELVLLPLPGEPLMAYCGFLIFKGQLHFFPALVFLSLGAITGTTIAYIIGKKLGAGFFQKHGHKFHMGEDRINKVHKWFDKYGSWILIISYHIPGVRHITGYFSGIIDMKYKTFALKAYTGAVAWVATFLILGSILGEGFERFHEHIIKYAIPISIILLIIGIIIIVIWLIIRKRRKNDN